MTALLEANDVTLFRGETCLVRRLSFALNTGDTLLLTGPNGSGKTTLLRAVAGLLDPEEGTFAWRGQASLSDRQAFHAGIAWFSHRVGCKGDLSVLENLRFDAGLRILDMARLDAVLERTGLTAARHLPFRSLSAGQQRRVGLCRLLLSKAPLWLMDEPLTNLDRDGQMLVVQLVATHTATGGACMLASHQPVDGIDRLRRIDLA